MCCCHGVTQGHPGVIDDFWSAQRSGGRPLGRRYDDGGVEDRMLLELEPNILQNKTFFL